jgi:uncharacterized membrane protein YccC
MRVADTVKARIERLRTEADAQFKQAQSAPEVAAHCLRKARFLRRAAMRLEEMLAADTSFSKGEIQ